MKKLLIALSLFVSLLGPAQDHGHLNLGATGLTQNDPLSFANRDIFETTANYVKTLTLATNGAYAGYYQGNITFTGLAATEAHAGPEDFAAALGTQIHVQLVAVTGPPGGVFSFWESGATTPTISLASGSTGTNTFRISENDGSPDSDPYGHIHGRRFTATKPGIYTASFRAFDFSTNGASGGPLHTPSSLVSIYFQAGVNLKSIAPAGDQTRITFAAPVGKSWVVEASDSVAPNAIWTPISTPIVGDDYFHEIHANRPVTENSFYRTRGF
jgi:hypothetical protein